MSHKLWLREKRNKSHGEHLANLTLDPCSLYLAGRSVSISIRTLDCIAVVPVFIWALGWKRWHTPENIISWCTLRLVNNSFFVFFVLPIFRVYFLAFWFFTYIIINSQSSQNSTYFQRHLRTPLLRSKHIHCVLFDSSLSSQLFSLQEEPRLSPLVHLTNDDLNHISSVHVSSLIPSVEVNNWWVFINSYLSCYRGHISVLYCSMVEL